LLRGDEVSETEEEILTSMAGWVSEKNSEKPKACDSVPIFLALRQDVIEAMAAGYSRKTIWDFLVDTRKVPFTYGTFIRYVKRHITDTDIEQERG
jgi:Family of unknown function (DUF5338)